VFDKDLRVLNKLSQFLDSWFVSEKLKKMNSAPYALIKGRRRMMRVFLSIPMPFC